MVIGGGDTAASDALYLSGLCRDVTLIHRRDRLRAADSLQKKLLAKENVRILWDTTVKEVKGDSMVSAVIADTQGQETTISADGVFVAVGVLPDSALLKGKADTDMNGYILTDDHMQTSIRGVYAAGDVRKGVLRQIITAASDAAIAVESIVNAL